jgi:hypothetical protein
MILGIYMTVATKQLDFICSKDYGDIKSGLSIVPQNKKKPPTIL